ncbi:Lactose transport system permease protein LacF [Poriferisphaera corsica]|uniref:Lactose transport system permease protein LacF n=1 Tax=Poriferisphaera corsica TaxID=2528020 RepID=A0A517YRY3_9BACT|nr:sugar ABC transporter permease [Poriferisphaera corsica]QDU32978.1 Lactose transport system permease protein LacF [Poriferisphaera corsica]
MLNSKTKKNVLTGLAFLTPNICGVALFVVFPVVLSIYMAFSDWNLTKTNPFKENPDLNFIGVENFVRLFTEPEFFQYFKNTLFLMMGIPFGIGAALISAVLLSQNTRTDSHKVAKWLKQSAFVIISAVLGISVALMFIAGGSGMGMMTLLICLLGGIIFFGVMGGNTVYRTLFYLPSFTAGVPTYVLWKKLYNPRSGPINTTLQPVLDEVSELTAALPTGLFGSCRWIGYGIIVCLFAFGLRRLRGLWDDGEIGKTALIPVIGALVLPIVVASIWRYTSESSWVLAVSCGTVFVYQIGRMVINGRAFTCKDFDGFGNGILLTLGLMVLSFIVLGLSTMLYHLPGMVSDPIDPGLNAPNWLGDYAWAKPSMMIIGFWAAMGSNNMLLYLAALTNVPQQLYEAADIDGASRWARFWNVTWPQLAPTTFFIAVMSIIGGLQGGFEMARTLTNGGPAGATTPLSFFIYNEGFETGRLGYSAAIAWVLFLMIFSITLFNWKFGNRYVND